MEIQAAVGGGGSKAKEIVEVWEIGKFTFQMSLSLNKVFFFPTALWKLTSACYYLFSVYMNYFTNQKITSD